VYCDSGSREHEIEEKGVEDVEDAEGQCGASGGGDESLLSGEDSALKVDFGVFGCGLVAADGNCAHEDD